LQYTNNYLQYTNHYLQYTNHYLQYTNNYLQYTNHYLQYIDNYLQYTNRYLQYANNYLQHTSHYLQYTNNYFTVQSFVITLCQTPLLWDVQASDNKAPPTSCQVDGLGVSHVFHLHHQVWCLVSDNVDITLSW